ncbi:hypothetical protein ACGFMO_37265 [Streptomyces niveus]|uniref:hypothetical protein n=1 Tax=Streptomyces niveus TaxID=193462 RepID=UPI00371CF43F
MADPKTNVVRTAAAADLSLPALAGGEWEVVRIAVPLGLDVVARCHRRGIALGPVWITPARSTVEIVAVPGTAGIWPGVPGTTCAKVNLAVGRRWIHPPTEGRPAATDAYLLAEVVTDALVRLALTRLSRKAVRA